MQSESVSIPVVSNQTTVDDELADFSTNRRVLLLSAIALVIMALVTTCMTGPFLTFSDYLRARKRVAINPA